MRTAKIFKYFFFLIFLLVAGKNAQAQVIDADTIQPVKNNVIKTEEIHSPKKAALYSLLPGLGQAYNKKYWKIPIVYAGLGTIGYFAQWNNKTYKLTKTAYSHLNDDDPTTEDYLKLIKGGGFDLSVPGNKERLETAIVKSQVVYRRNRDLLIIGMVAFYGLNIIDASVDAHLFNFDIGDDLTMNWQPSMLRFNNELAYCINLSFNF